MPAPGSGGDQTSLTAMVQGMMASARRVPPQAGTNARRADSKPRRATRPT
jgi:hypothetical protein